jgi:hypothetical protein
MKIGTCYLFQTLRLGKFQQNFVKIMVVEFVAEIAFFFDKVGYFGINIKVSNDLSDNYTILMRKEGITFKMPG